MSVCSIQLARSEDYHHFSRFGNLMLWSNESRVPVNLPLTYARFHEKGFTFEILCYGELATSSIFLAYLM